MNASEAKLGVKVRVRAHPPYEGVIGSDQPYDSFGRPTSSNDGQVWVDGKNGEKGWVALGSVDHA